MSETLKFKDEELFKLLLKKITNLETSLEMQSLISRTLLEHIEPEGRKALVKELEEQRPLLHARNVQFLLQELKGVSVEYDTFLKDLIR